MPKSYINSILEKDISDSEYLNIDKRTVSEYLDILDKLILFGNHLSYSSNYRSFERIGKNEKRHFTDPSLASALLNLNSAKLIGDLKIYMDYLNGNIYHFRDNVTGLEVDLF